MTSTPFPFFDSEDEENVDFDYSGMGGNLTLEDHGTDTLGWAVYTFGSIWMMMKMDSRLVFID